MENKKDIRKKLREGINKNIKGVDITRPNQVLIIMRGVPGSGKSTKAKSLVGEGIIHSTDDLVEATGDYRGFFNKMNESKDFSPLSKMHSLNFKNAKKSMLEGISPIVIDNTNIKSNEPKKYVESALNLGYDEKNIMFVEVGTGGCTAEQLGERNTHGVPLDKIKSMIESYNSVGKMTLKKVLEAKSMYKEPKIAFVHLDDDSRSKLFTAIGHHIPKGWDIHVHHMTINFGKGLGDERKDDLGRSINLIVDKIGITDKVIAVTSKGYPSDNKIPHITIAVNPDGGTPVMSNDITDWEDLNSYINVSGVIKETTPFKTPTTRK